MVPAWTLVLTFAAGLAVGAVACLLVTRPGASRRQVSAADASSTSAPTPAEVVGDAAVATAEPPAAAEVAAAPLIADSPPSEETDVELPAPPAERQAADTEAPQAEDASEEPEPAKETLAAGVTDVVAELERRYKGRKADADAERGQQGRR